MTNARRALSLLILLLSACPSARTFDLLTDGGFDAWCDGEPCHWEVVSGEVSPVSTWHPLDRALSLDSDDAAIRQIYGDWYDGCFELEVLIDGPADVRVEIDFFADGNVEESHVLRGGSWQTRTRSITSPFYSDSIAVVVYKEGDGAAVLGHVRLLERTDDRENPLPCAERVEFPQPLGLPCATSAGCQQGECAPWDPDGSSGESWFDDPATCGECSSDDQCGPDEVCGIVGIPDAWLARSCVPVASRHLAERCAVDGECVSGRCEEGLCAECGAADPSGCSCTGRYEWVGDVEVLLALTCDDGPREAGDACLSDEDCRSGRCEGSVLRQCLDDRRSCTAGVECLDAPCVDLGVLDGQCG